MVKSKPVVELDMILDWIRCPMRVYRKKNKDLRVFEYESLLRFMLLNSLKAGYRDVDSSQKLNLEQHVPDIWEYLLKIRGIPKPQLLIRKMNEFYSMRSRYIDRIEKRYLDSTDLLNMAHWWDLGLIFDTQYFHLRDEINKYQSYLGFPDWNIVKTYYREYEYNPVSLADTFGDYLRGQAVGVLPMVVGGQLSAFLSLENRQKVTTAATVSCVIVSLLANLVFLRVLNLGAFGLALSTSVGMWMFFAIQAAGFFGRRNGYRFSLSLHGLRWNDLGTILKVGLPGAVNFGYQAVRGLILNRLILQYAVA